VRLPLSILSVLAALCALPAVAAAHDEVEPVRVSEGFAFHSDTAAELPPELVTRPVAQAKLLDPAPVTVADATELPETWCGVQRTTDDVAAAINPDAASIKVIYAYASDQAPRHATVADRLQANVSLLSRFVAGQSGGRRTIRFDMGTSCGPAYVDIQTIALPSPRSYYVEAGAPRFSRLADDVRARVGAAAGPRDYLVYADDMRGTNGVSGTGEFYYGPTAEQPGGEWHNQGGLVAAVWGVAALPSSPYADPTTMLHEITHNLGAVQGSAPNSTGEVGGVAAGHCVDEQDIMCYADGGPNNVMRLVCPALSGSVPETYDCGGDDYFNATPADGSWLAAHWNLYNSSFLGACGSELAATCGASGSGDAYPPTNTTPVPPAGWVPGWTVTLYGNDVESPPADAGQWRVNGGPASSTRTVTISADGVHQLATRVADRAGNWSPWRTDTVRVDVTPPVASLSCRAASAGIRCRATGADGLAGVRSLSWSADGGAAHTTTGDFKVPARTGRVVLTATDAAGNRGQASAALAAPKNGTQDRSGRLALRNARKRTVAKPTVRVRPDGAVHLTSVAVPRLRLPAGRWRTRICLTSCRAFDTVARKGRIPARDASWRARTATGVVRVTVSRRSHGRWVGVLSGRVAIDSIG
jgi:hypothetical protein